MIKIWTRFR